MNITMDLSEVLLYLELMKKHGKRAELNQLNFMLFFLENYEQVKMLLNKLDELEFRPPFVFYNASLIHFIEDYHDCLDLKNKILQTQRNRKRRFSILFIQQIMLSKTKEQALSIIEEAKEYGINLGETWSEAFNSMWRIKIDQKAWKENIKQLGEYNRFTEIFENFNKMKTHYFESLPLKDLKKTLLNSRPEKNNQKITQSIVYDRSVYIKEFARKIANGICQLCENDAPFKDKQGNPFLEVHHVLYLSQGGSDSIDNVVALCPNCHRKVHHLELDEDYNKLKQKAIENIKL